MKPERIAELREQYADGNKKVQHVWNITECLDEIERLRKVIKDHGLHKKAPCVLCGYNGPGFFEDTHECMRDEKVK